MMLALIASDAQGNDQKAAHAVQCDGHEGQDDVRGLMTRE
jgi:hypothetical protein